MIPLNISSQTNTGFTLLSNTFIDCFMDDANDAQIKVYLYLLRTLSDNIPTDISEIADKFNYTEKDIIKSIKHWENKGVVSVTYNKKKEITGIIFNVLESYDEDSYNENLDNEDSENILLENKESNEEIPKCKISKQNESNSVIPEAISMIKMDYEKEKASYSAEKISELKNDANITLLLNTVPMYFGRMLTQTDIRSLLFIYDRLGFSYEMIDCMIEQSAEIEKKNMHFVEYMAISMYEQGINTVAAAKKFIKSSHQNVYTVMKYLGKFGVPTDAESKCINEWLYTYGFSLEVIKVACDKAAEYATKSRMSYANVLLTNWHKKNVKTVSDIEKLDEEFELNKKNKLDKAIKRENDSKQNQANTKTSSFLNMQKHNYNISEIEEQLLSN